MSDIQCDLLVIGGGVNGAGIARDAAGRGLSVVLIEAEDLASGTSSASTKLIHGGLRYLEFFEFKLVRESLQEREKLLRIAPHIIWPMEFILPHNVQQRPFWMVRFGLFLYDHLARRNALNASRALSFKSMNHPSILSERYVRGFSYADCWADDSRLVVLNARDAANMGAKILTRTKCERITPSSDHWMVETLAQNSKEKLRIKASMVVNAAGPWARDLIDSAGLEKSSANASAMRLVKGSHLIAPQQYEGAHAYILQQDDKRVSFVIPYEGQYTLIGTTEEDYQGDPSDCMISDAEFDYLLKTYNQHFKKPISKKDVVWTYSGVRPLVEEEGADSRAVSRDYSLYTHEESSAPMISVFGGKLTTYRVLAEEVVDKLLYLSGRSGAPWTADKALPGGDIPDDSFEAFFVRQVKRYNWLPSDLLYRYARSYGRLMHLFLEGAKSLKDLGQHYGDHVYEAEILYLVHYEWARGIEDILWRRSKLGVHVSDKTIARLEKALPKIVKEHAR